MFSKHGQQGEGKSRVATSAHQTQKKVQSKKHAGIGHHTGLGDSNLLPGDSFTSEFSRGFGKAS